MDYEETKHARVSVNRAIAELKRHDCVTQAHVSKCGDRHFIIAVSVDGEATSFKIDSFGMVKARPILDWLGY